MPAEAGGAAVTVLARDPAVVGHGLRALREVAARVLDAGLRAADPRRAARDALVVEGDRLLVGDRELDLRAYRRVWVVGAGKASGRLAQGVEDRLGPRVSGGLVVVRRGAALPLARCKVLEADHPVPSLDSLGAARALMALAAEVGPDDLVVACVSGASSALVCLPAAGIGFGDKRRLHELLLACGAGIAEVNTVRKHTSAVKAGRLAEALRPATIVNVTVSDVAGDPADLVCDLTVRNRPSTAADAIAVLERFGLWERVPAAVRSHLLAGRAAPLPALEGMDVVTVMPVTSATVAGAMLAEAGRAGVRGVLLSTELEGPAEGVGAVLASLARSCARRGAPFPAPVALVACGGESTVRLPAGADFGAGGPNQEVAVAAATALRPGDPVVVAAIDSDGSDGGGGAAGGMVDSTSGERAAAAGVDLPGALRGHRASEALAAIGDLVVTGPTHTNVNDLVVAVAGEHVG